MKIKHKGLKEFYETGKTKGVSADQARRIGIILAALEQAESLEDLNRPAFRLHELKGTRAGTWSISVNGAWRITFIFEDGRPEAVNLEQYH